MVPTRTLSTRVRALVFRHPEGDPPPPVTDPPGADQLGDAGKKALDDERRARREAERTAAATAAELAALRAEAEELRTKAMTEQERQLAAARAEIEADVRKTVTAEAEARVAAAERRVLEARASAAAAGKLANPADATMFLKIDDLERDAEGNVSDAVLGDALDALIKERPYLAATTRPHGSADQGHRRDAPANLKDPKQLGDELARFGVRPRT